MEKLLGQNEIDALFNSARASVISAPAEAQAGPVAYNFSRTGQISNEQMRAISTVNDLFARNLTHNLGGWLRTELQANLVAGEQMAYSEFTQRIPSPAYVASVRLEPLGALGIIQFDLALAAPMVDLLLGGTGRAVAEVRNQTEIEEAILVSVMEIIVRELNVAWAPVGLQFTFEKREPEAEVRRLMLSSEKTLCVNFELRIPEVQGTLNFCMPAVVLNNILRKLITERDRPRRRHPETTARMTQLMGEVEFGTVMQFPMMRLQAREIVAMVPGSVLRLPLSRHSAAELRVGGLLLYHANPVRQGEHRGARIESGTSPALMQEGM